jgi:pyruvate, water dikinase
LGATPFLNLANGAAPTAALLPVARGHASPRAFYVDKVAEGVATIAAAFWPKPVIVRLSDFKSNEYRKLIGGSPYEPEEENPMLGFRVAARYISQEFGEAFAMECEALKRMRNAMGLTNVEIMVPFVRTLGQAKAVGVMLDKCGLDRDSGLELLAKDFDERDPAVKAMLAMSIKACLDQGKYVGICGQGPSDHPDFAKWLVEQGITSISLNPDSVVEIWKLLAQ